MVVERKVLVAAVSRRKFLFAGLTTFLVGCAILLSFSATPVDAAVGSGGAGSGGSANCNGSGIPGCPWTSNGHGWRLIPVDASDAPRGNGYWSTANPACKADGATHVMAYVVFTGERTLSRAFIYKFPWSWGGLYNYNGTVSVATAEAEFYKVPAADRSGYTFGSNVGWFCYNISKKWNINAQSYIQKGTANINQVQQGTISATPGERLNWYHDLRNTGPDAMDKDVNYRVDKTGFSNGWNSITSPSGAGRGGANVLFTALYATNNSPYSTHVVTQDDVGHTLCQRISWNPLSWNNTGRGASNNACANVPYNYTLTPSVSSDSSSAVEARSEITVNPMITNSGPTKSTNVAWQLTRIQVNKDGTIPNSTGGNSAAAACGTYFRNSTSSCSVVASGSSVVNASGLSLPAHSEVVEDLEIGTKICYSLSVQPYTHNSTQWRHSAPICIVVGKKPKVQVWGGDLLVGRTFTGTTLPSSANSVVETSISQKGGKHTETIAAPQSAFSGLWKTGVDNNGNKLASNAFDPHWIIDRVYRPAGYGGDTCQWISNGPSGSASLIKAPTTSSSTPIYARVIGESGGAAGTYMANDPALTGSPVAGAVITNNGMSVWGRTSPTASWIGQNAYGQNYSRTGCQDPTFSQPSNLAASNIYVFKLKDGFNIDPDAGVDLNSARIYIGGAMDNAVKFFVNGHDLGPWQTPGWSSGASATSNPGGPGVFRNGNNSLEIHVQSTYSHTGLLIDNFRINATAQREVSTERIYGSWIEYGIFAPNYVNGTASGSGLNGGAEGGQSTWSQLTFSNDHNRSNAEPCASGSIKFGCFVSQSTTIPDVVSNFPVSASTPRISGSVAVSSLPSGVSTSNDGSNITINLTGGVIDKGRWHVINAPNATVNITGNITYTNERLNKTSEIPQLIIIAKDINITGAVSQVDAWLITPRGSVVTCSDRGTAQQLRTVSVTGLPNAYKLSRNHCSNLLTINGPIMAESLWLRRTAGSEAGTASGDPAEIINLRPDTYLWTAEISQRVPRAQTVFILEDAPRL